MGSKYARYIQCYERIAYKRTMWKYYAVSNSNAGQKALRNLGFSSREHVGTLHPLHLIAEQMYSWRHRIPRNNESLPVVSAVFDPYQACIVAPDHILLGHFRDCANFILDVLTPVGKRLFVEKQAIRLLR